MRIGKCRKQVSTHVTAARAVIIVVAGAAVSFTAGCGGGTSRSHTTTGSSVASSPSSSDIPAVCQDSLQITLAVSTIQTDWIDEDGPVKLDPLIRKTEALDQPAAAAATDPNAKQAFQKDYADVQAFGAAYATAYRSGVNYGNGYDNTAGQAVETALTALINDDSQRESLHLCG